MDTAFPLDTDLLWTWEWPCWAPESHWWSGRPVFPHLETTSGQCGSGEVPLQNQISLESIKKFTHSVQLVQLAPRCSPCANLKCVCCNFSNFTSSCLEWLDNKEHWRSIFHKCILPLTSINHLNGKDDCYWHMPSSIAFQYVCLLKF